MTKIDLFEILKNPNDKLILVDMDGTLCQSTGWEHINEEPKPIQETINLVNSWYLNGAHIVIFSSRLPQFYSDTVAWLIKYGVSFHGVALFIKPGCDIIIDDKALNIEDI